MAGGPLCENCGEIFYAVKRKEAAALLLPGLLFLNSAMEKGVTDLWTD
jgi:hypothetical protein